MKFRIETYGCSANVNDSEIMAGLLARKGHKMVAAAEEADVVIVNTCTVKDPTEAKIRSRIRQLQREYPGKRLVIAGCMAEAQTESVRVLAPAAAIVGTHRISRVVDAVEGRTAVAIGSSRINKAGLPKSRINNAVSIVQINEGCLGSCTFCITKMARGKTFSYPAGTIANSIEAAVKDGCKEVWLTSQDTGTYGLDRGTNLPLLLQKVCEVKGDFLVRVGMMNPTLANALLQPLIKAFSDEKVFKFLHLPLQSGSNNVLAAMKRGYTVETFSKIVAEFRKHLPQITISTDIICGFPTEAEDDFKQTAAVVEAVRPDVVNVSRFWPRPGTEAAWMKRLPDPIVMRRSKKLHALAKKIALENNREWLGWTGKVLFDERGKLPGTFVGRNLAYRPVVVRNIRGNLLGKMLDVEIFEAAPTHLVGKPTSSHIV